MIASQLSRHAVRSVSSALYCPDFRLPRVVIPRILFHTGFVAEECVARRVQQIQILDRHWHEHVVVLRVCFPRQYSFDRFASLLMSSSSTIFFMKVAFCVCVRFSLPLELGVQASSLCLVAPPACLRLQREGELP